MKRKVIQIAGSTQLISLPRKWSLEHNVQKGDELDVEPDGNKVVVSTGNGLLVEKAELDVSEMETMAKRAIHALYKRGVDEIKILYKNAEQGKIIHDAIRKETVGFEILEQGKNHCTIKYVAGSLEEFDSILRRTFLLLMSMGEETLTALKEHDFSHIKELTSLEEANNRFTSICRRYLNKKGATRTYTKVGPIYGIIEELENIADTFKYICQHFGHLDGKKKKISKEALDIFERAINSLRLYYEIFYKFDSEKTESIKKNREYIIKKAHLIFDKKVSTADLWLTHHSILIGNRVFTLLGPLMVLNLPSDPSD